MLQQAVSDACAQPSSLHRYRACFHLYPDRAACLGMNPLSSLQQLLLVPGIVLARCSSFLQTPALAATRLQWHNCVWCTANVHLVVSEQDVVVVCDTLTVKAFPERHAFQ
jgi:hypothetical protein